MYKNYYEELQKVKSIISYFKRIKDVTQKQIRLTEEYKRAYGLFKQDKHFTVDELSYMGKVYSGILDESLKNIDQLFLVVSSFTTQMSDAKRLEIINAAADHVDVNYNDLKEFNQQSILLSLQRAKVKNDVYVVKKLYGRLTLIFKTHIMKILFIIITIATLSETANAQKKYMIQQIAAL